VVTDDPVSGVRFSRRALGTVGGGILLSALAAPEASAHWKKPGRNDDTVSPLARRGCSVTALNNGMLLVAGGIQSSPTSAVQLYDPGRDDWFAASPMITPRAHHAAVLLWDGKVLVCGGRFLNELSSAEIYDPRGDDWESVAPMSGPRAEHGAAIHAANVVVTGGINRVPLSSVELYDLRSDSWRRL
jgi:hypothetical protein